MTAAARWASHRNDPSPPLCGPGVRSARRQPTHGEKQRQSHRRGVGIRAAARPHRGHNPVPARGGRGDGARDKLANEPCRAAHVTRRGGDLLIGRAAPSRAQRAADSAAAWQPCSPLGHTARHCSRARCRLHTDLVMRTSIDSGGGRVRGGPGQTPAVMPNWSGTVLRDIPCASPLHSRAMPSGGLLRADVALRQRGGPPWGHSDRPTGPPDTLVWSARPSGRPQIHGSARHQHCQL